MTGPSVIALVPAHNEEDQIADTLAALLAQTHVPDKILVVLDNCTDGTEDIVRSYPVDYLVTTNNPHKKAGALNQALSLCAGYDYVLDTDADAILDERFCELSVAQMERDPLIGAVSAREGMKTYPRMSLGQRVIYVCVRYQRHQWDTLRMQHPSNTLVVVGPGGMIRTSALMEVGGWDNDSLTEDNALSIDLREHGWRTVLGKECFVWSDTPLGFRELWQQRVRWARGAEDYASRKWSRATWRGKLLAKYQWCLLLWALLVVPYSIISINYKWYYTIPLMIMYSDRLWRLNYHPSFRSINLLLATPLGEFIMFVFWQAATVTATYHRLVHKERNWLCLVS